MSPSSFFVFLFQSVLFMGALFECSAAVASAVVADEEIVLQVGKSRSLPSKQVLSVKTTNPEVVSVVNSVLRPQIVIRALTPGIANIFIEPIVGGKAHHLKVVVRGKNSKKNLNGTSPCFKKGRASCQEGFLVLPGWDESAAERVH